MYCVGMCQRMYVFMCELENVFVRMRTKEGERQCVCVCALKMAFFFFNVSQKAEQKQKNDLHSNYLFRFASILLGKLVS